MILPRVLEPEVMASEQEAHDYDAIDNREINGRFCDDLLAHHRKPRRVLDVGTGTALIPLALLERAPEARVYALDLSAPMLERGLEHVRRAGLSARIALVLGDGAAIPFEDGGFDVVMSNSIVHHVPEPIFLLRELVRTLAPGGLLFVRDLARPATDDEVNKLVAQHAAVPPEARGEERAMFERQRQLFDQSLRAGLRIDEVRALLKTLGIPENAAELTSDRHWTLVWKKPGA